MKTNEPERTEWVVMGPEGDLAVAVPLYPRHAMNLNMGIKIDVDFVDEPLAVIIDLGDGQFPILSWQAIKDRVEILSDLRFTEEQEGV